MLARLLIGRHSHQAKPSTRAAARCLASTGGAAPAAFSSSSTPADTPATARPSDRAASHAQASPSAGPGQVGRSPAHTLPWSTHRAGPLLTPLHRGFATSAGGGGSDSTSSSGPAPPSDGGGGDDDDTDWGAPLQSLADMDDLLDDWEDLMAAGDLDGVLRLLEARTAGVEGLPPLAQVLASPPGEADERALRRALEAAQQAEAAARRVRLVDGQGRAYATGRRKAAVARVWVRPGSGKVWINGGPLDATFAALARRGDVLAPFAVTGTIGQFDVRATVVGGGATGQAQAIRHGLARALQAWDPALRPPLKAAGLLTRDPRVVERKKPGKAKARKSFQWVKR